MATGPDTKQPLPQFTPDDKQNRRQIADWMREMHQGNFPNDLNTAGRLSASAGYIGVLSVDTLSVAGTITASAASIGQLSVSGLTIAGTLTVNAITVLNTLSASAATIGQLSAANLFVAGSVRFDNTLTVSAAVVFKAGLGLSGTMTASAIVAGVASILGTLSVSGATTLKTTLSVGGDTILGTNLTVNGVAQVETSITTNRINSRTGSATALNTVATTVYSIPNASEVALWLASVNLGTVGDAANYGAAALIVSDGAAARLVQAFNATLLTVTLSGLNVQGTQASGTTQTLKTSLLRIL